MKLQNGLLVHCEDTGSGAQRALRAMTRAEQGPLGGPPWGAEPPEPSPAELVQCQEEMGSLLCSIAELNMKIGRLKAPSESEDFKPSRVSKPVLQGLWPHRLPTGGQERHPAPGSKPQSPPNREGRRELWPKLQKALTAVERSVNTRRKWAILTTATDLVRQTEHLVAAETITTSATQILEEIERELGISFPPAMPNIERPQCRIHSSFGAETKAPTPMPQMGEMGSLRRKLEGLQKAWSSRSSSPPYSPPGASLCGPRSPRLTSPPPYPGSPLLLRRPLRAFTAPLSTLRDTSPPGSPRPARGPGARSASPAPSSAPSHESETERVQRCVERLRARNQRLSSALERQTAETPQGDRPTLQMALAYCQECEEAYSELLSLYELNKQQGVEVCQFPSSGPAADLQQSTSPPHRFRFPEAHELSTSFSTAGGAVGGDGWTLAEQRAASVGREAALRLHIQGLTAACPLRTGGERPLVPAPGLVPDPVPATCGLEPQEGEQARAGTEKIRPFEEPFTVGEEMAERSAETHLAEEELRCLDWALQALKAQDSPPGTPLPPPSQSPGVGLLHRAEPQSLPEAEDNGNTSRPQKKDNLEELHVIFQRDQGLKKRLSLVRESLATALRDSAPRRRDSNDPTSRKAASTHRSSRRRYQEQVWRLEQKVAAMSQSHQSQIAGLKATVEALEGRREETAL